MKNKLKTLFSSTRGLEARLADAFESRAKKAANVTPSQPFELVELAAEELGNHVHLAGRGRYTLPYNSVTFTFAASSPEQEARFRAICDGPPSIQDRVVKRLVAAGCDVKPDDIDVHVVFVSAADESWTRPYHLALAKVDASARPSRSAEIRVDLLVTNGTADRGAYTFTTLPIAIGRGADVRDQRHQLLRINYVAFAEGDASEVNKTVSRRHARIELDPSTQRPRLVDDNSAQGTSVLRRGRGIAVPRGSRGLGLQSGDEIVLGQARLTVTIGH